MSFLGPRFRFRATGSGMMHCYRCGGDRQYESCTARRWIHILFIPAIPLDRIAEHVQCRSCRTRYRIEVLTLPTSAQMEAALPTGALATGLRAVLADAAGVPVRDLIVLAVWAVVTIGLAARTFRWE